MLSNNPPEGDALTLRLGEMHASLQERADELLAAVARVPATLDETTHDRAAAFVKQMKLHARKIDESRTAEKEPYLEGGRTIDAWFRRLSDPINVACKGVETKITAFLRAKADAERKAREEDARKAREEAERRAAEMRTQADLTAAVAAEETAAQAEKAAAAKVTDLARTRTAYGTTSTLRTVLDFEIVDHDAAVRTLAGYVDADALARAARAWLRDHKAEAELLIKDAPDAPEHIKGVRLFHNQTARVA